MKLTLHIWRQSRPGTQSDPRGDGRMVRYELEFINPYAIK